LFVVAALDLVLSMGPGAPWGNPTIYITIIHIVKAEIRDHGWSALCMRRAGRLEATGSGQHAMWDAGWSRSNLDRDARWRLDAASGERQLA